VSIVGRTNSGKTTLIERLISALSHRGYRVATIKHHHHGDFEADQPGKDSWRDAHAGAIATALAGARRLAVFQQIEGDIRPDDIARMFVLKPDLILTEDYKGWLYPKIEVIRAVQNLEPICKKHEQLIALVTDGNWDLGVPCFELDAIEPLAEFLVKEFLLSDPRR
jgi:molybdopterin-guanine dinucleotide biosynthesis protein B